MCIYELILYFLLILSKLSAQYYYLTKTARLLKIFNQILRNSIMSKNISLSVLFILFSIITVSSVIHPDQDSTRSRGKYALLFQVGSNFQLQSFSGATFSFKYQMNKRSALRLGLSISGASSTRDFNQNDFYPDTTFLGNEKTNSINLTVTCQYLRNIHIIHDVAFYYGGGPVIGFSYSRDNTIYTINNVPENDNKSNSYNAGLSFVGGVEWYLAKNISLLGEYGFSFTYTYLIRNYVDSYEKYNYTTKGYSLGSSAVKLGVSVYF